MKTIKLLITIAAAVLVLMLGLKYFDVEKEEIIENKNVEVEKEVPTLSPQAGLPAVVEAKRQAIYKAAISRDLKKLEAEAATKDSNHPDYVDFYHINAEGKSSIGLSGRNKFLEQEKQISIFDLFPTLLNSPYSVSGDFFTWPSAASKNSVSWTQEETNDLKRFLTDEQIERFKDYFYTYPKITITSEGKWVNRSFFYD